MRYIYDIVLNFNEKFYEFYEWKQEDNVDYIKKIPIIKVSNKAVNDLKLCKIKINSEFLKNIYNKCEIYMDGGIGNIEYACLFCSDDMLIAIEFNYKGISMYKSSLLIDEEVDILNYVKKLKESRFEYSILERGNTSFITREEVSMIDFIIRELNQINEDNNIDKLKYLYYECFNKRDNNIKKMNLELKKYINTSPTKIFNLLMIGYLKK